MLTARREVGKCYNKSMSTNLTDFLVIGDVYIINNEVDKNAYEKVNNKPTTDIPKAIKQITDFKDTLKQTVTNTVKPGVVHRPSAGELMAKEVPTERKEADEALKDTLDQIPELQEAKRVLEGLKK